MTRVVVASSTATVAALGDSSRVARSFARWIRRAAAKDAAEDGDATLWELPPYSPRKSVSRSAKPRGTAPEKGAKGAQH